MVCKSTFVSGAELFPIQRNKTGGCSSTMMWVLLVQDDFFLNNSGNLILNPISTNPVSNAISSKLKSIQMLSVLLIFTGSWVPVHSRAPGSQMVSFGQQSAHGAHTGVVFLLLFVQLIVVYCLWLLPFFNFLKMWKLHVKAYLDKFQWQCFFVLFVCLFACVLISLVLFVCLFVFSSS